MKKFSFLSIALLALPFAAYAQVRTIPDIWRLILNLLSTFAWFLLVLAVLLFFWGLVKFIMNADDAQSREDGKKFIIWGLISFFVIFSVWALLALILDSFDITVEPNVQYIDAGGQKY